MWDESDYTARREAASRRAPLQAGDVAHAYGVHWQRGAAAAVKRDQWEFALALYRDPSDVNRAQRDARVRDFLDTW